LRSWRRDHSKQYYVLLTFFRRSRANIDVASATMNPYYEKVDQKLIRLKHKIEEVERTVFHTKFSQHPPTLYQELMKKKHHKKLKELKRKGVLNSHQYDLLFPSNQQTDSRLFDTTLLHVLLRSVCGFKNNTSVAAFDWNNEPPTGDHSVCANLVRLKIGQNRISHLGIAATNNTFYKRIYKYLKRPLLDLGCTANELNELIPRPFRFKFTPSVVNFANRDTELKTLHDTVNLVKTSVQSGVCLSGLSGIGKTQLVKRYFETHSGFFEHNVVWIDASDLQESFKELAQALNLTITDYKGQNKLMSVIITEIHEYFWEEHVLFVFDNCCVANRTISAVINYLPIYPGAIAILTAQRELSSSSVVNLKLASLSPVSAFDYVSQSLGCQQMFPASTNQRSEINEILERLGYHPLAIQQFITFLQETRLPPSHYLKILKEKPDSVFGGVINYIKITVNKLKLLTSPLPLQLLQIACFLNGKEVRRGFFIFLLNQSENMEDLENTRLVNEAMNVLERYSLITVTLRSATDYKEDIVNIHSLVQHTMKLLLRSDDMELDIYRSILARIFKHNKKCENDITFVDKLGYSYFLKQLMFFYQAPDTQLKDEFLRISKKHIASIFNIFYNKERLDVAASILCAIERHIEKDLEVETASCCSSGRNEHLFYLYRVQSYIAQTYYRKRNFFGASLLFNDVRKKQKRLLGNRHRDYLTSSLGFVSCLSFLDKYEEGSELAGNLHRINARVFGEDHPHTLLAKRVLAINRSFLENMSVEVIEMFGEVLERQIKVHGEVHAEVFTTRHVIAQRQRVNRIKALTELLSDLVKAHPDSVDSNEFILRTKYNIGREYLTRGNYEEALRIFDVVHNAWLLKYGDGHEDVREIESFLKYLKKYIIPT